MSCDSYSWFMHHAQDLTITVDLTTQDLYI